MYLHRKASKKIFIVLMIVGLFSISVIPSAVQSQSLNEIKVMLLNDQSDYEGKITASSSLGLILTSSSSVNLSPFIYNSMNDEKIGIQYDRYSLLVLESTNLVEVINIVERIKNIEEINLEPIVEVIKKNNIDNYRVTVGSYETITNTYEVQQAITNELKITSKIIGNLHWSFGTYSNKNDALLKVNEINNRGFNSYVAQVYNNGIWEYQVWVGDSATTVEHQQLKQSLQQQFVGINILEANSDSYVIYKETGNIVSNTIIKNSLMSFSKQSLINLTSKTDNSYIKIDERKYQGNSLRYRGEIYIQLYNNELAVVNHLPLDTYLYSVVGSEMYNSWPLEALKAQAVAARTFAYQKLINSRNPIANIYDTTADQAYYGVDKETNSIRLAVDETKGTIITYNNNPITAFYSSNAGGTTSHGTEVWGDNIPFTSVKPSTWDELAQTKAMNWYFIVLSDGNTGYVRSDFINLLSKKNTLGLSYGILNDDKVNLRVGPSTYYFDVLTTLSFGQEVVILDTVKENNSYSWIAGPLSADFITQNVNHYQLDSAIDFTKPILDLKISQQGPSGRVTLLADGNTSIPVKYPDYYRTLLGGLSVGVQSSLFEIEQTGRVQILGAGGVTESSVNMDNQLYLQSADGISVLSNANNNQEEYMILDKDNIIRVATKEQSYIIHGQGLGHGTGMSQWGAKGMAEAGYTYQQILEYYYNNIFIKQIY